MTLSILHGQPVISNTSHHRGHFSNNTLIDSSLCYLLPLLLRFLSEMSSSSSSAASSPVSHGEVRAPDKRTDKRIPFDSACQIQSLTLWKKEYQYTAPSRDELYMPPSDLQIRLSVDIALKRPISRAAAGCYGKSLIPWEGIFSNTSLLSAMYYSTDMHAYKYWDSSAVWAKVLRRTLKSNW